MAVALNRTSAVYATSYQANMMKWLAQPMGAQEKKRRSAFGYLSGIGIIFGIYKMLTQDIGDQMDLSSLWMIQLQLELQILEQILYSSSFQLRIGLVTGLDLRDAALKLQILRMGFWSSKAMIKSYLLGRRLKMRPSGTSTSMAMSFLRPILLERPLVGFKMSLICS